MDRAVRVIIEKYYERCVRRVIYRLRRIPSAQWQYDDAPMKTAWDWWKMEMQDQHSDIHGLLSDLVEEVTRDVVDALPTDKGTLMTLETEAVCRRDWNDDEPSFHVDEVAAEVLKRVNSRASDEPHRKAVQAMLDREGRDRWERDNERFGQAPARPPALGHPPPPLARERTLRPKFNASSRPPPPPGDGRAAGGV